MLSLILVSACILRNFCWAKAIPALHEMRLAARLLDAPMQKQACRRLPKASALGSTAGVDLLAPTPVYDDETFCVRFAAQHLINAIVDSSAERTAVFMGRMLFRTADTCQTGGGKG